MRCTFEGKCVYKPIGKKAPVRLLSDISHCCCCLYSQKLRMPKLLSFFSFPPTNVMSPWTYLVHATVDLRDQLRYLPPRIIASFFLLHCGIVFGHAGDLIVFVDVRCFYRSTTHEKTFIERYLKSFSMFVEGSGNSCKIPMPCCVQDCGTNETSL